MHLIYLQTIVYNNNRQRVERKVGSTMIDDENPQENQSMLMPQNAVRIISIASIVIGVGIAALTYQLVIIPRIAERTAKIEATKIQSDREQAAIEFAKQDEGLRRWAKESGYKELTLVPVDDLQEAASLGINMERERDSTSMRKFESWTGEKQFLVLKDPEPDGTTRAYAVLIIINSEGEMHII